MPNSFGTLLRDLRKRSGMTQDDLATRLGYSRAMVAMLEVGKRQPDVDEVIDIYLPALGLEDSHEIAAHLVELAAAERRKGVSIVRPIAAVQQHKARPRIQRERSHLPAPPTPLLGREREVESHATRFLENEVRFLTLVGPPGVGKTRLALEIAQRLELFYEDGVHFVALAGVGDVDSVVPSILGALHLQSVSDSPLSTLVAYLRRKELLLVLDNFEQILGAATYLAQVQSECVGVQMLVTSRERLRLRSEYVGRVRPLYVSVAANLFMQRALAVDPDLSFLPEDAATTEAICRRLDCLPLAIELCAAQVDYFTPAQLLVQLEERPLDALELGALDLPPHQQTLRAAIGASYATLDVQQRQLLLTLSVFAGGATPAMADEVWREAWGESDANFDKTAQTLVAKNLLQIETTGLGERRLLLLESIREFGREQLATAGMLEVTRERHYQACLRYARVLERETFGPEIALWMKRSQHDADNMHAAMTWAYEGVRWGELATLLNLLWSPSDSGARLPECLRWCEMLLPHCNALDATSELITKLNYLFFARRNGDEKWALGIRAEYLSLIERCDNPLVKAQAIRLGVDFDVDFPDTLAALEVALTLANATPTGSDLVLPFEFDREVVLPVVLHALGTHLVAAGEGAESARYLEESLALHRQLDNVYDCCFNLIYLGRAAMFRGEYKESIAMIGEALEMAHRLDFERAIVMAASYQGLCYVLANDQISARKTLETALEVSRAYGDTFLMIMPPLFLAELSFAEGKIEEARAWFGECVAISVNAARDMPWRHIHRAYLAARLAALDHKDANAATYYGFALALNERIRRSPDGPVRDTAAAAMNEVRTRMGDDAYQTAISEGGLLSPAHVLGMMARSTDNRGRTK